MSVRTEVYQGLLWQQVIDEQRLEVGAKLPPLLLLVLYNGERRWKAATRARNLIALPPDSSLWPWQPGSRYCLLDIGNIPRDELVRRSSLVALLFRLEQHDIPEEVDAAVDAVVGWFIQHQGHERLEALFAELICETCARYGFSLPKAVGLLEVKTMFLSKFETWKEQLFEDAKSRAMVELRPQFKAELQAELEAEVKAELQAELKAEIEAELRARLAVEAKAQMLIFLLSEKFGAVPPTWGQLIQEAGETNLNHWLKRAIVATDLPSVFNPPRLKQSE